MIPVEHARYIAEHIVGSRYLELPGADTLHCRGDAAAILDEIEEFVTGARGSVVTERVLTTIVFTDIVGSTQRAAGLGDMRWHDLLDNHDRIVRQQLRRFSGREVKTAGDGFVATFPSPSVAIDCAEAIVEAVRPLGIEIRAGYTPGRSKCVVPTSPEWRCTSVRGSARPLVPVKCLSPRSYGRSSQDHDGCSPSAANTTSKACPAGGAYTP
jgi:hypothetical protein